MPTLPWTILHLKTWTSTAPQRPARECARRRSMSQWSNFARSTWTKLCLKRGYAKLQPGLSSSPFWTNQNIIWLILHKILYIYIYIHAMSIISLNYLPYLHDISIKKTSYFHWWTPHDARWLADHLLRSRLRWLPAPPPRCSPRRPRRICGTWRRWPQRRLRGCPLWWIIKDLKPILEDYENTHPEI